MAVLTKRKKEELLATADKAELDAQWGKLLKKGLSDREVEWIESNLLDIRNKASLEIEKRKWIRFLKTNPTLMDLILEAESASEEIEECLHVDFLQKQHLAKGQRANIEALLSKLEIED